MDDPFSDYDDFSDGEGYNPGLCSDLSQIRNSTLKYLNYTTDYVRGWGLEEAFREIYQNWRDGILRSFKLTLSQFCTVTEEKGQLILVKAFKRDGTRLLGFIRFQYDKNGEGIGGGLKIANFNATLPFRSLGTGATSKASDHGQTGQHGEGMKLGALVFRRMGYNIRIESGTFKWTFMFKKGELACGLRRMTDASIAKLRQKDSGPLRTESARPWEDVCVIIGASGAARDIHGNKMKGKRLHVDSFRKMLTVTLDVNTPQEMLRTIHGDLIQDSAFQGKMYLRGLLLPSGGKRGTNYAYGYNFVDGNTTRDREAILGADAESEKIAAIWASAILADDSLNANIAAEYTDLLLNSLNHKGDVVLDSESGTNLDEEVATIIWKQMLSNNHDQQGRTAFYYSATEHMDEVQIIEQSLNKISIPLDATMWKLLRQYNLCRTPAEELRHRFEFAEPITTPDQPFAKHVDRMLRCLLSSSQATKDMQIVFVDGATLQIDTGFFETTWRIHNRWLTYAGAHQRDVFCEGLDSDHQHPFVCDHVVLHLWDIMLSQLKNRDNYPEIAEKDPWLKSMALARLSQTPRSAECVTTDRRNELRVSWQSVDSHQNKDKTVNIILHVEGCTDTSEVHHQPREVLQYLSDQERKCPCPSQLSPVVNSNGVVFTNLLATKAYFPSISRDIAGAFVALPPESVSPLKEDSAPSLDFEARSSAPSPRTRISSSIKMETDPIIISDDEYETSDEELGDTEMSHYEAPVREFQRPELPPRQDRVIAQPSNVVVKKTFHDEGVQTEFPELPSQELYVLGPQISHSSLDWGGTFPGSHAFYRTRDKSDKNVFILKPKRIPGGPCIKREAEEQMTSPTPKASRVQGYVQHSGQRVSKREDTVPPLPSSSSRTVLPVLTTVASRDRRSMTRETAATMTPVPEGGINYRY
ncbi:hypothetical protein BKA63DRAFT_511401 [Paraphoma chrysanthemicola]|nr:hypothetical protein BKA63DRAFT_511401 [Paraphoma chrysanthemicola]